MKHLLLPLLLLLSLQTAFGQFSGNAELNLKGMASTEKDQLPFWMHHNQRGRIENNTNVAGWVTGRGVYTFSNNSVLEVGAGVLGRDGEGDDLFTDELYAHYETNFWSFTAGRKQQEELYNGLSASNRSILWSLNARPLPGLQLKTTQPIFLFKNFGFEAAWEEYLMDDERFVKNARLHHKSFHLVYSTATRDFEVKAGIQHFAQWGGTSPVYGDQPEKLQDYLRIFTGSKGEEGANDSDQQNALGNHLGGYELKFTKIFAKFNLELFYNHLFEDGSGRRLGNTPDGRYGLFINFKKQDNILNSFVYEFYTTHHQSHTTSGPHKSDDYFNNGGYNSGWTYNKKTIGAPFFTVNPNGLGIINNKFTVHHFGVGGSLKSVSPFLSYKVILSYALNDGRRHIRFDPKQEVFYSSTMVNFAQRNFEINLQLGCDLNLYKKPIYGAGLYFIYKLR